MPPSEQQAQELTPEEREAMAADCKAWARQLSTLEFASDLFQAMTPTEIFESAWRFCAARPVPVERQRLDFSWCPTCSAPARDCEHACPERPDEGRLRNRLIFWLEALKRETGLDHRDNDEQVEVEGRILHHITQAADDFLALGAAAAHQPADA